MNKNQQTTQDRCQNAHEHPAFFPSEVSNNFVWISERNGYNNLYYYDINGKLIQQLTSNKFVVKDILCAINKGAEIIFSATGESPLNTLYYSVSLKGSQRLLTKIDGLHTVSVAPNEKWFFDEYSNHATPSVSSLVSMNGKSNVILLQSTDKLAEYKIGKSEIIPVKNADGTVS